MKRPTQLTASLLAAALCFIAALVMIIFQPLWIDFILILSFYGLLATYLAYRAARESIEPYYIALAFGAGLIFQAIILTLSDYLDQHYYPQTLIWALLGLWFIYRGWKLYRQQ